MSRRNSPEGKKARQESRSHRKQPIMEAARLSLTKTRDHTEVIHAQQVTHDQLVDGLGPNRRSGIRWFIIEPPGVLDALINYYQINRNYEPAPTAPDDVTVLDGLDGCLAWVTEYPDAVLVVAVCTAVMP